MLLIKLALLDVLYYCMGHVRGKEMPFKLLEVTDQNYILTECHIRVLIFSYHLKLKNMIAALYSSRPQGAKDFMRNNHQFG